MLDGLPDLEVRERFGAIWDERTSLYPAACVNRGIVDLLATLASRLDKCGHIAEHIRDFLKRLLFTIFAEDSGLVPEKGSTNLLNRQGRTYHQEAVQ